MAGLGQFNRSKHEAQISYKLRLNEPRPASSGKVSYEIEFKGFEISTERKSATTS